MFPLLHIEDLSISFRSGTEAFEAVRHLTLPVNRGELLALVGESGSGKSVTALSILRLLAAPPTAYPNGHIWFSEDGVRRADLLQLEGPALQRLRGNRIAMIFQEPMTSLNPVMSCGRQITEVLQQHKGLAKKAARREAVDWLRRVQLPEPEKLFHKYPHQISGGQKQRVMIAMAICCRPALLICDEPTTALDVTVQREILTLIQSLQKEEGMGVLFITHDLGVVSEIADRVAILYRGELVEQGGAEAVFKKPVAPYTRALIACRPSLHPQGERLPVVADFMQAGEPPSERKVPLQGTLADKDLVEVRNLTVRYPGAFNVFGRPRHHFTAVDGVSFSIRNGETMGLVGESGCGKTTLSRALLRLIEPDEGQILFDSKDVTHLKEKDLKPFRRAVQLVFQDPFSSLNPRLLIGDALEEPLRLHRLHTGGSARRERVKGLLDQVGLPSFAAGRYAHQFSGGQRQRIVIARALALDPHFLVCDESVSALDVSVQAQVLNLLNDLKRELGLTLLFISHDLSVVRYMSDRLMVMHRGRIVEQGPSEEIYRHPKEGYTQKLLAAIPGAGAL